MKLRRFNLAGRIFVALFSFLILSIALAGDLDTIDQKFQFLTYLRRNQSNIYDNFVVRFNSVDFLNDLEAASQKVNSNIPMVVGTNFVIHEVGDGKKVFGSVDKEKFENQLLGFIRQYSQKTNPATPLRAALTNELRKSFNYETLQGSLFQVSGLSNAKEILKLPFNDQIAALTDALGRQEILQGFNPRKLGISRDTLSGAEFIQLYKESYFSRENSYQLLIIGLFVIKNDGNIEAPVSQISESLENIKIDSYLPLLDQETFQKSSTELGSRLATLESDKSFASPKYFKFVKASYDFLKQVGLSVAASEQPVLIAERGHPYEVSLRGLFGDCASTNSAVIPYASQEETYWLRKPEGQNKGYLQFTHVISNGENALYVHTISGAAVSRYDARNLLLGLFDTLNERDAKKIILPVPEKIFFIINYPEVELVFRELVAKGKRVPIRYLDSRDRAELTQFTEGALDLPESNQFGIEITKEDLLATISKNFYVTAKKKEIKREVLFANPTDEEILAISLEIQHQNKNSKELLDFLARHSISTEAFNALAEEVSNPSSLSVAQFHESVKQKVLATGIRVDWNHFIKSNVFYKGNFASPDAIEPGNFDLSMSYITNYVLSYSGFDFVYSSLHPHFSRLVQQPEFVKLVKLLFRRNLKETDRVIDFYELQSESAFRTLANLFKAGLPIQSFQTEIAQLESPLENGAEDSKRKDGIFFRRIALLGSIYGYPSHYFDQMIERLEKVALSKVEVDSNDMRVAAQFLANYLSSGHLTAAQNDRIYSFLVGSHFGHSFAPEMGVFRLENLNVPGYFDALMNANQPKWAAHLIHKKTWTLHELAAQWVSRMWDRKDEIGYDTFLHGFTSTPEWLNVEGIDKILDGLLSFSRQNLADEDLMTEMLLSKKQPLTALQLSWLAEVSTPQLAKIVLEKGEKVLTSGQYKKMQSHLRSVYPPAKPESQIHLVVESSLKKISTINVFSGAPQHTDTPTKYAGFGDIAVNLVAAVEMKSRNPNYQVRLLVTGASHRYDPLIPTTAEIMKIMVPSLDPKLKGTAQIYEGVEVIFVDYDFANILNEENENLAPELMKDILEKVPALIPKADFNVNFSYFPGSADLVRMNAPLSFGIEENYDAEHIVDAVFKKANVPGQGAFVEMTSGPSSGGFMTTGQLEQKYAFNMIEEWTKTIGLSLSHQEYRRPLIAYTSERQATQIYIDAIAALNISDPTLLVVKDFADLDVSGLSPNIKVIRSKGIPHEVVRALIQESVIAPLVTGDTSFGQALSSVRPKKTFIYEAPDWKLDSARAAKKALTSDLSLSKQALLPMFLNANTLKKQDRRHLKMMGQRLAKFLKDEQLQNKVYHAIQNRVNGSWDLIGNTLEIANETFARIQTRGADNGKSIKGSQKVVEAVGEINEDLYSNKTPNPFGAFDMKIADKKNLSNSCKALFN